MGTNINLSCVGQAVSLCKELGGERSARIFWVEFAVAGEETVGHAYVIQNDQKEGDFPRNRPKRGYGSNLRVKDVLEKGLDKTEEYLNLPESLT